VQECRCHVRAAATCCVLALVALWSGCAADDGRDAAAKIEVDPQARTVSVPAEVAKQEQYLELRGAIEYALVATGGKEYETVFTTRHTPREIHDALLTIGLRPGQPADAHAAPRGQGVKILVEHQAAGGTTRRPLEEFLLRVHPAAKVAPATGKAASARPAGARGASTQPPATQAARAEAGHCPEPVRWPFAGSGTVRDPETGAETLQAMLTRSVVGLHWSDASSLLQNPRPEARRENIYRANVKALPPPGTPVRIIFQRPPARGRDGARRAYVRARGRLRGTGYATFTAHLARRLKLAGFVRPLGNGRAEAVVEGPAEAVEKVLAKMKRGPLAARVKAFDVADESPEGDFQTFEIWY